MGKAGKLAGLVEGGDMATLNQSPDGSKQRTLFKKQKKTTDFHLNTRIK